MNISKQVLVIAAICWGRSMQSAGGPQENKQYFLNASAYPIIIMGAPGSIEKLYRKILQPGDMVPADLTWEAVQTLPASYVKKQVQYKIFSEDHANNEIQIPAFIDEESRLHQVTTLSMNSQLKQGIHIIVLDIEGTFKGLKKGTLRYSSYKNIENVKKQKEYAKLAPAIHE